VIGISVDACGRPDSKRVLEKFIVVKHMDLKKLSLRLTLDEGNV
jgi:hypothetical protein